MKLSVAIVAAALFISVAHSVRSIATAGVDDIGHVINESTKHDALGGNLFDSFFAGTWTGSGPVPSDQDMHCGKWCRSVGGGSSLDVDTWIHFKTRNREFGDVKFPPDKVAHKSEVLKDVSSYSFNGGKGIVVQWSGAADRRIEDWLQYIGRQQRRPFFMRSRPSSKLAGLPFFGDNMWIARVKEGLGETPEELFSAMCGESGTDGKTEHKVAFELSYASDVAEQEAKKTLNVNMNVRFGSFIALPDISRALLVLKYKCHCEYGSACHMTEQGIDQVNSLATIRIVKMAIYLSTE